MPKWVKTILAILLLPVCAGAISALVRVLRVSGGSESFWVAFVGGVACWIVVFLILPKPMLIYVFGHELTHALWTWLFGGRVKRFKVTSNGGHVVISKSNFLIVLAPYFFPLYVVALVALFALGHVLFGWNRFLPVFHLLVGAAYAFHLTLTWHILQTRQSDITSQGWIFSAVIIFLGNIAILIIGLPMLTSAVSVSTALGWWLKESGQVLIRLGNLW